MIYIANSLSSSMLADGNFAISSSDAAVVRLMVGRNGGVFQSCVGHTDTAAAISADVGFEVRAHRQSISLRPDDLLIVAELQGGRLPEGTTTLPEGFSFRYRFIMPLKSGEC